MYAIGANLLLLFLSSVLCQIDAVLEENYPELNGTSFKYYNVGVDKGIINPEKYTFESFLKDEQNIFKDVYKEFTADNDTQPANYEEWLIMNNFGILPDTQESLFSRKRSVRSMEDNKRRFVKTVRKGDILITKGPGIGGLLGHAAIMTTDNIVLEMPGGKNYQNGIKDNNRQIRKDKWFDIHKHDWTTVYRCPNGNVAKDAAVWADHTYYNPKGGSKKTKHITYRITKDVWSINPSYCSKLVVQAYHFGTGKTQVINANAMRVVRVIPPLGIPTYFTAKYRLANKGKF